MSPSPVGADGAAEVGAAAGSVGVSALVWQALRSAVTPSNHHPASAESDDDPPFSDDAIEHLPLLWDAVWLAAEGKDPKLTGFPTTVPVPRLLESVRRSFLDLTRNCGARVDVREVLRVLTALEHVQVAFQRDCAQRFTSRLAGPNAMSLVVEVAHDMRSPITSILFLVEMLRKAQSGPINKVQERQLGLVYSAAFGLSAMASDVIELAKGGDRLVDPHPVPFSVREIMDAVCDIVQPIAEEKGLEVRIAPPEASARVGHPAALSRVLLNLTTNALKFTSKGFVEVTAKQLACSRVEFAVRDTGRGIPPEVVGSLFDPFRRRQQRGHYAFSSAGLGLAICRKLVQAMGGELRVETELNVGTRFFFQLDLPFASHL